MAEPGAKRSSAGPTLDLYPMPDRPPAAPADRLAAIIAWLASCVAEQGNLRRLPAPLLIAIWKRLRDISARFLAVAATKLPPPRLTAPNPAPHPARSPRRPPRRPPVLPRGARWLLRLIPGAAASRSQREALLREPEMAALLAADPRLDRIPRPLCRMRGVNCSVTQPPRKRRAPPKPEPSPDAPDATFAAAAPAESAPPTARPPPDARFHPAG